MSGDPERMRFGSGLSPELRRALSDAKDDLPNDRELAATAAALGVATAASATAASAASGAGLGLKIGKLLAVLAGAGSVTTAAVIGIGIAMNDDSEPPSRAPEPVRTVSEVRIPATVEEPAAIETEVAPVIETGLPEPARPRETRRANRDRIETTERAEPETAEPVAEAPDRSADELALLLRARRAARSSPSEALRLVREHQREFGPSRFGEEREAIAIEALARSGRRDEARRRADAFRRRHPGSIHLRAIDALVPRTEAD